MPALEKRKTRPAKTRPSQSPASKAGTVEPQSTLCLDRDKAILLEARKAIADCLRCGWNASAAASGDDPSQLVECADALSASLRRAGRLSRSVAGVSARVIRKASKTLEVRS